MPRPTVVQQLSQAVIAVTTTPQPLSANPALQNAFIDSFILCVYSTAANSVFLGDSTVSTTTGMEIPAGISIQLSISNERQLNEVADPLIQMVATMQCRTVDKTQIPFVYWDLSQLYLIAAANTNVVIIPFKRAYV